MTFAPGPDVRPKHCPHCGVALPTTLVRLCPACGGDVTKPPPDPPLMHALGELLDPSKKREGRG